MTEMNHLCELWEQTIVKGFRHDPKSEVGLMLKQWVIFNKLEHFNSILNYTYDDFTPSGNLSYINEHGQILHQTPLKEAFNLQWYIQHLMDQSEDEDENPLNDDNWMKQTIQKFAKYVVHHRHSMTPEQLKQNLLKEIIKIQHEPLDTEEGESNEEEKKSITSSQKSEQDSETDTSTENEEESNTTQTLKVHHVLNNSIHDLENSSEDENDTSDENSVIGIETPINHGDQNNIHENKLLTTNFEVKVENQKVEGFITYSPDQQIFKFKVISGSNQEVWGVCNDFQSIQSKWTIDATLQHVGFCTTTENPNVMMMENHNTQTCEYITICQDGLYIVSTTPEEILLI